VIDAAGRGQADRKARVSVGNPPRKRFLKSNQVPDGPGVLTTLLRVYIEEHDRNALDTFFELLYDEHFSELARQVHSYGKASDVTVKEVIDDSLARLVEDVVNEKYRKAPESAAEHLKYLLRRRFIDRRRYWDRNHEDVVDHRETIVDANAESPAKQAQARENEALLDSRLEGALASMNEESVRMIRLRLEGRPHEEIAREFGLSEASARKSYYRAVNQLMANLLEHSPSLVMRLRDLKADWAAKYENQTWPTLDAIRDALPRITERVRTVLERFHFQGVSRETLAAEFGSETLEVLLRRGYDILESRFKVSFPEAFERATA
jgi:RNA polymerase sigma factor (sigma-70 family)